MSGIKRVLESWALEILGRSEAVRRRIRKRVKLSL
jgi:hypothetical protein